MGNRKGNEKITSRDLRLRASRKGFLTIAELANHIGCSRQSIYFALERPSRYSRVYAKLLTIIE